MVEGNYLLLGQPGWAEVSSHLDEVWYLDAEDRVIERRLTDRCLLGGKTAEQAQIKITNSDMPNARLIAGTRDRADMVLREIAGNYLRAASSPTTMADTGGLSVRSGVASTTVTWWPVRSWRSFASAKHG
ncbi:hypothetical protein [Nocardia amamiensis]|uniref:hypothetical protein n=1 Tax=Nocardia amamiensis TaxID=404578 RepID=UPI000834E4A3|nr:hypothetical protein [Nocardia amamiensis]